MLRPGVILGPHENVGRLTWWLRRMARGGRVLGPGAPDRPIQPIDARDVDTVRDTWIWMGKDVGPIPYGRQAQHGLSPERERQLLALWGAQVDQGMT